VALVSTDVWEEHIASIIRVTRIGELGTMLASEKMVCFTVTAVKTSNLEGIYLPFLQPQQIRISSTDLNFSSSGADPN
jgi:hypothetical protein